MGKKFFPVTGNIDNKNWVVICGQRQYRLFRGLIERNIYGRQNGSVGVLMGLESWIFLEGLESSKDGVEYTLFGETRMERGK